MPKHAPINARAEVAAAMAASEAANRAKRLSMTPLEQVDAMFNDMSAELTEPGMPKHRLRTTWDKKRPLTASAAGDELGADGGGARADSTADEPDERWLGFAPNSVKPSRRQLIDDADRTIRLRHDEMAWNPKSLSKGDGGVEASELETLYRLHEQGKWRGEYNKFCRARRPSGKQLDRAALAKRAARNLKRFARRDGEIVEDVKRAVVREKHFDPLRLRGEPGAGLRHNACCEVCGGAVFDAEVEFMCGYCNVVVHHACATEKELESLSLIHI